MHNETVLRLGVFGGTFNPPHSGHAGAASACVEQLRLDKLLLIPTRQPPHKALPKDSATAQQRLEMVKLLAEDLPKTEACDLEIRRGGTSYTWQTMQQLTEEFPQASKWLLMGTDMFFSFDRWKNIDVIAKCCRLAVAARSPVEKEKIIDFAEKLRREIGIETDLLRGRIIEISSTQLRRELEAGTAAEAGMLPAKIERYIRQQGLYQIGG